MSRLPSLDMHAHVSVDIATEELPELGVVFAATRTLEEAAQALDRDDASVVWGVGCHPGLVGAHKKFNREEFERLVAKTAFVAEVGLDGKSRVAGEVQANTLTTVLEVLQRAPRIVSIHSYSATGPTIDALEATPVAGAIMHWWLGNADETRRAIESGCYFSVNASSVRRADLLEQIPLDRLLPETDHPFGDRKLGRSARPGNIKAVEKAISQVHGTGEAETRLLLWRNLAKLVSEAGCGVLLPRGVRRQLAAV